jgi:Sec-independent protein translocase protein TatA
LKKKIIATKMASGISFSEILLILVLIIIFVDAKQIPGLIRKSVKVIVQLRTAFKKFIDEIDVK